MFEPRVTILHVDDNEANRYVVRRILQNAGFASWKRQREQAGLEAIATSTGSSNSGCQITRYQRL